MRKAWAPAVPPPSKNWPGYALLKVRLTRHLARRAGPSHTPESVSSSAPDGQNSLRLPLVERRMSDPITGIYGTPDLIERADGRLRVVDLKSGLRQTGVTEGQRRQLLLYGHLVACTLGGVPDDLIITDLAGKETVVPSSPADISEAVDLAVRSRESWNTSLASGGPAFSLASPSPQACQLCPFRVACLPYWEQSRTDWEMPAAVSGTIGKVITNDNHIWISVTQDLPCALKGQEVRIVGFLKRTSQ